MLSRIDEVGDDQRRRKMRNGRVQQIVTSLYLHANLHDEEMQKRRSKQLMQFFKSADEHSNYWKGNNDIVLTTVSFLKAVFEYLYA